MLKITFKEYEKECNEHGNKRGGCMNCKFYDRRWLEDKTNENETWCMVSNLIPQQLMRKWEEWRREHNRKGKI